MFGQYLVHISSNSEMVKLQPFVELTRNDPTYLFSMASRRVFMILKLTALASGEPIAMSSMPSKVTDDVILVRFCRS